MSGDFFLDFMARFVLPLMVVAWGARIYRWQRKFDRRADWYSRTHAQIYEVMLLFDKAAHDQQAGPEARARQSTEAAIESGNKMTRLSAEGFMFGVHNDHVALFRFTAFMREEHARLGGHGFRIDLAARDRIRQACNQANLSIATAARRAYALPRIDMAAVFAGKTATPWWLKSGRALRRAWSRIRPDIGKDPGTDEAPPA